jgi:hypothetical protein
MRLDGGCVFGFVEGDVGENSLVAGLDAGADVFAGKDVRTVLEDAVANNLTDALTIDGAFDAIRAGDRGSGTELDRTVAVSFPDAGRDS